MSQREHELKCWPEFYQHVESGEKTFEIRKDDRGFRAGDILWLREWSPKSQTYSNKSCRREITYVLSGQPWLQKDYVCMALRSLTASSAIEPTEDNSPQASQAEGWKAVVAYLNKKTGRRDWICGPGTGIEAALKAIDTLIAQAAAPVAQEPVRLSDGYPIARAFHDAYERLAPQYGYETRADTKQFDPTTPNGKLMVAVCAEMLDLIRRTDAFCAATSTVQPEARPTKFEAVGWVNGQGVVEWEPNKGPGDQPRGALVYVARREGNNV